MRWTFEELAYVFVDFIPEVSRSCSCEEYVGRSRDSSGYSTTVRMPVRLLLPSPQQHQRFKLWLQEGVLTGRFRREVLQQVGLLLLLLLLLLLCMRHIVLVHCPARPSACEWDMRVVWRCGVVAGVAGACVTNVPM